MLAINFPSLEITVCETVDLWLGGDNRPGAAWLSGLLASLTTPPEWACQSCLHVLRVAWRSPRISASGSPRVAEPSGP